ncbi:MAG TPA: alpha-mannosidase, partial [Ardenticatenaceae bacterium]|nr:alpha-mannosidase [Ardenticatenaceae bacterium]
APELDDRDWEVIAPPAYWGEWQANFMLRGEFRVPDEWGGDAPVALYLPLGDAGEFTHPDALLYVDGAAYAACDRYHQEILLPEQWRDGHSHALALHGWFGRLGEPGARLFMRPCSVVQIDRATRDFIATARVALGVARILPVQDPTRTALLNALDDAFKRLDTREPFGDRFYASVPAAHELLRAGIERAGPPLDVEVVATGHAHIDVAWLWTLGQTRRKAGRSFYTVLRLMEQFPDYHFTQSQPQLYDYVRQDYPALFEAIKARVAEGRWEITGDMWVEADCNLSSGESLARQFLLGRSFFREHFGLGTSSRVLWLPDVFGYAWSLPQLIKEADLEYFFTIKIGWSQYNRLPYDSFWWQGLDGTRVLTHFSPTTDQPGGATASTYNAHAVPVEVLNTWTNFQQKELVGKAGDRPPPLLMSFGHGDGGGGPTREMLENLREMRAFPALPRVTQKSVGDFFRELEETAGDRLPVWSGELYLEFHRGTYTTQSRNKRANRKNEFLLHDAELLATMAALLDPAYGYPAATFQAAWQLVCLNQFHDIIPGSSITAVYTESLQQYEQVTAMGAEVLNSALRTIARVHGGDLLLVNPTSFARGDLAFWPGHLDAGQQLLRDDGEPVAMQPGESGVWLDLGGVAPFSVTALRIGAGRAPEPVTGLVASAVLLENALLRVELDQAGDITRIYDKRAGREVLPPGAIGNQFQAFEDRPLNWDAWDVDIFYDDKMWTAEPASSVRVVEAGPLCATLEIRRQILGSQYVQRISLAHNSARLDFETTIDWRERHVLLKVAFPVEVFSPVATYEIQWGNVQRPTHRNTSWDWARFETCAQKWVDLSEGDYGVSLLNDCKYGHDIRDNVMRISLLRGPTSPDPQADLGEHHFRYSLLPHTGGWSEVTISAAYALNDPLIVADVRSVAGAVADRTGFRKPVRSGLSFLSVDQPNIVVETVKRAEDGRGVIVRMYESQRRRGQITLRTGFKLAGAWRTNLLEEDQAALEAGDDQVKLFVRPYEIVTLRLVPA